MTIGIGPPIKGVLDPLHRGAEPGAGAASPSVDLTGSLARGFELQEAERKRISRELHDEVGQALMAISINFEILRKSAGDPAVVRRGARQGQKLVAETMDNVRRLCSDLNPVHLDRQGLLPAMRSYARQFAGRTGIRCYFRSRGLPVGLGSVEKSISYRILQEALTNVHKHSGAGRVDVFVKADSDVLSIVIQDDGKGFGTRRDRSAARGGRLGLVGLQDRAHLAGGKMTVSSVAGRGTILHIRLPIPGGVRSLGRNNGSGAKEAR